jgi:hypothetical protein
MGVKKQSTTTKARYNYPQLSLDFFAMTRQSEKIISEQNTAKQTNKTHKETKKKSPISTCISYQ